MCLKYYMFQQGIIELTLCFTVGLFIVICSLVNTLQATLYFSNTLFHMAMIWGSGMAEITLQNN